VLARDEARHGDLAWAIARWAESRLSPDERAAVTNAREAALRNLRVRACALADPDTADDDALGLPSADQAARLAAGFVDACRARHSVPPAPHERRAQQLQHRVA
jgi:hypothetical protein